MVILAGVKKAFEVFELRVDVSWTSSLEDLGKHVHDGMNGRHDCAETADRKELRMSFKKLSIFLSAM